MPEINILFCFSQLLSLIWLRATHAQISQLVALDVKCDEEGMNVHIEFDGPFNGILIKYIIS